MEQANTEGIAAALPEGLVIHRSVGSSGESCVQLVVALPGRQVAAWVATRIWGESLRRPSNCALMAGSYD